MRKSNSTTYLSVSVAVFLLVAVFAARAADAPPDPIQQAFQKLYNLEFAEAHQILDRFLLEHPNNPMAHSARAAVYLFTELDRLDLLASEFFEDRGERLKVKKLDPDPELRAKLFEATQKARECAREVLAKNPKDPDAWFALSSAAGIESDYQYFVEKKRLASLKLHKESHNYSLHLLEIDPDYPDAYLTSGFYDYVVGDLPFFLRWFISFDGVEGSKEKGIERMEYVAHHARYTASFAKILLAAVFLREEQPDKSLKLLTELTQEYPKNPLFPREIRKICKDNKLPLPEGIASGGE